MGKGYKLTARSGRCVQIMFDGTNKWVSSGCHTEGEARAWAEARLKTKNDYLANPEHDGFRMIRRTGRNIQVQFAGSDSWESTGYDDEYNATLWARSKIRERAKNDITFSDYAHDFYTRSDPRSFRGKNERKNRWRPDVYYFAMNSRYVNYLLPMFGGVYMRNITSKMIDDWLLSLNKLHGGGELSANSKNKILQSLSFIMREAALEGVIDFNPCDKVDPIAERMNPRQPLSDAEMEVLFPENDKRAVWIWGSLMWACYFYVMKCTGFRPGEVAGLTIDNYYPELGGVYTTQTIDSNSRVVVKRIKTSNKGKNVKLGLLTDQCCRLLDEHIKSLPEGEEFLFKVNNDYVTTATSNKHFCSFAEKAEIKLNGRTQYSLRHTFQTKIAGEIEDRHIEELMGHTKYRQDYDHRDGVRRLQQLQGLRNQIKEII